MARLLQCGAPLCGAADSSGYRLQGGAVVSGGPYTKALRKACRQGRVGAVRGSKAWMVYRGLAFRGWLRSVGVPSMDGAEVVCWFEATDAGRKASALGERLT